MLSLNSNNRIQTIPVKSVKEHFVALFILPKVVGHLLLQAVIGQMRCHMTEVLGVGIGSSSQHALSIQVHVVEQIHQHPTPGETLQVQHQQMFCTNC